MKKILIVDDTEFMRMSIRSMLENNGFEVIGEAENGYEAIAQYIKLKPDIVTMDITMPQLSGIDAVKSIIQIDSQANIVMVSAMGQEQLVKESIMSGAKTFVVKPFKEEVLIKTLSQLI